MVEVNWSYVIGLFLIVGGVIFAIAALWSIGMSFLTRNSVTKPPQSTPVVVSSTVLSTDRQATTRSLVPQKRGADDPAPLDAVKWVLDIRESMGVASSESVLASLVAGESRDQARARRISELECNGAAKQESAVVSTAVNETKVTQ